MNAALLRGGLLRAVIVLGSLLLLPNIFHVGLGFHRVVSEQILNGDIPYVDFLWEYPPATVPFLYLRWLFQSSEIYGLVLLLIAVCAEVTIFAWLRSMPEATTKTQRAHLETFWLAGVVPLGVVAYFHLDYLSALVAFAAMVALRRGQQLKRSVGWATLGVGLKLWPIVIGGAMFARRQIRATIGLLVGVVAGAGLWFVLAPSGFRDFLQYRKGSGFQIESTAGSVGLALGSRLVEQFGAYYVEVAHAEVLNAVFLGIGTLVCGGLVVLTYRRQLDPMALVGAIVVTMLLTNRLFSPQFLTWLVPFVGIVGLRWPRLWWAFGLAAWLTIAELGAYVPMVSGVRDLAWIIVARNLALAWLLIEFIRALLHSPQDEVILPTDQTIVR